MKKCPSCAEQIQDAAIVCKYCRRNVPRDVPQPVRPLSPPEVERRDRRAKNRLLAVAIGLCAIAIIGALVGRTAWFTTPSFNLMSTQGTMARFVLITPEQAKSDAELWRIANYLDLRSVNGVQVMFWTDYSTAANTFPLTDVHLRSMVAQVWINKSTHFRELRRPPFD